MSCLTELSGEKVTFSAEAESEVEDGGPAVGRGGAGEGSYYWGMIVEGYEDGEGPLQKPLYMPGQKIPPVPAGSVPARP